MSARGFACALAVACARGPTPATPPAAVAPADTAAPAPFAGVAPVTVSVTLDGAPAPEVTLTQGGGLVSWTTDAEGRAEVEVDFAIPGGEVWIVAAHPEARTGAAEVPDPSVDAVAIALTRYDPTDNADYTFFDPGSPDRHDTTGQCAHCHVSITDAWYASPHRTSASNPVVHDLYAGVASAFPDSAACAAAGGAWGPGIEPGTGRAIDRCFLGDGVLPVLDGATGGCADCHAPGIDGALGGRDLLEAREHAFEAGVHCDVCHKVDAIDLAAEAGVAGRLRLTRPSEPSTGGIDPDWKMIVFGPYDDVPTAIMGAVQRAHFEDGTLCAGCHEHRQAVLVPGQAADPARWPDGRLPVHTTWTEWLAGPMNPGAPCPSCHMPPDPDVGNSADLGNLIDGEPGYTTGWPRPPGSVRAHAWYGPRQPASGMLALAARLDVGTALADGTLTVDVEVRNVGPGHAMPTGEPLRALVVTVEATCDGAPLAPVGGDVVPAFGGAWLEKTAAEDWTRWPGARPGQVVRVASRAGWRDYHGFGPFGDGSFAAEAKGLPHDTWAGEAVILAMDGDVATFDRPLPPGDVAWLGDAAALAGAPGFGFARVLVDAAGRTMVPHFLAVDVAVDNRLLPQEGFATTHVFAAPCPEPQAHVVLLHRAYPPVLAAERGWAPADQVMAEVWR